MRETTDGNANTWCVAGDIKLFNWRLLLSDVAVGVLAIVVTAFVSMRRIRRRGTLWTCTLREIGILFFVVAFALAWWQREVVAHRRDVAAQESISAQFRDEEGEVDPFGGIIFNPDYVGPLWLARLMGRDNLPVFWRAREIWFGDRVTNDDVTEIVSKLHDCPYIDEFIFNRAKVSDECLDSIAAVRRPSHLAALETSLSISALAKFGDTHLKSFVYQPKSSDWALVSPCETVDDLYQLERLSRLEQLCLRDMEIRSNEVDVMLKLTRLKKLRLQGCDVAVEQEARLKRVPNLLQPEPNFYGE